MNKPYEPVPYTTESQAARYHPSRHELTINADFRAITDLISHWCRRHQGVPGARTVIEGQVHEWSEQVLVEVVLATRSSPWTLEQLDALLSPSSLTAALLPRQLLHAKLQKRLAQKLGAPRAPDESLTTAAGLSQRDRTRTGIPGQDARQDQLRGDAR